MRPRPLHLEGILSGRPVCGPKTVHIDVTNACNLRCVMCWDHSPLLQRTHRPGWSAIRIDPAMLESLLDDLVMLGGLDNIILSGMGDPCTHPQIAALVDAVKARDVTLTLMTNLIAPGARPEIVARADELLVSVHGASLASWLAVHPGSTETDYDILRDRFAALRALGKRVKHVQVVSRHNADELVEMVRFGIATGAARITFKLASLRNGTEPCSIDARQRSWLLDIGASQAAHLAQEAGLATNLDVFCRQLRAGGMNTADLRDIGCFMGFLYARVLTDGTVAYCCNTRIRVGSLRDTGFAQLWRGELWNGLRERLRSQSFLPGCEHCGKLEQNVRVAQSLATDERPFAIRTAPGADP